jgi:hypothetical protein
MLSNGITRMLFFYLLTTSLMYQAFVFSPLWTVPPLVATILNVRIARAMHNRNRRDLLFAALIVPAEIYMWVRLGHFARSWAKFASSSQADNWTLQARAESGSGGHMYLAPLVIVLGVLATGVAVWAQLPDGAQSTVLLVGWTVLGVITIVQTAVMTAKALRRFKGFSV